VAAVIGGGGPVNDGEFAMHMPSGRVPHGRWRQMHRSPIRGAQQITRLRRWCQIDHLRLGTDLLDGRSDRCRVRTSDTCGDLFDQLWLGSPLLVAPDRVRDRVIDRVR